MNEVKDFADGFDTFRIEPTTQKNLSFEVGMHVNVGKDFAGATAYIFTKSLVTGEYQLVKAMTVNEIGNVALMTNELTEVMVLIQK